MQFCLHVKSNFWRCGVGEERRVADDPGGERRLCQLPNFLLADASSTSERAKADEAVPVSLPNTGASVKARVCVAYWSLTERTWKYSGLGQSLSISVGAPVKPGAQSQNQAVPLGS